jgi:regulator of sirC expression with transglutaminase-like and TPR domain
MAWLFRLIVVLMIAAVPLRTEVAASTLDLRKQAEAFFAPSQNWTDIKFAIDRLADPSLDDTKARAELELLKIQLKSFMGAFTPVNAHERLKLLKQFYYVAGPWNGNRPFAYDHTDPYGRIAGHKTFTHYLETRQGNCVTMPILFAILGKEIGLNMTLSTSPLHVFVKMTDEQGAVWNLETTSGAGYTRDLHYRKELPMTDRAVESGLYLRTFTNEEAIATMASTAVEQLMKAQRFEDVIAVTEVILKHHPRSVSAMIARGSAYGRILRRDYLNRFPEPGMMLPHEQMEAQMLSELNYAAFAEAEALGWTEHDGLKDRWPPQSQ